MSGSIRTCCARLKFFLVEVEMRLSLSDITQTLQKNSHKYQDLKRMRIYGRNDYLPG
jgi:hypothetical protein